VFELADPLTVCSKSVALCHSSVCIELEQFVRHIFHGLAYACLGFGPRGGPKMLQLWLCAFRGTVFLHQIEASERHIEPGAFGVFQQHELGIAIASIDLFQPLVLSDPMLDVDNIVAYLQIAKIGEKRRNLGLLALVTRGHSFGFIEQITSSKNA